MAAALERLSEDSRYRRFLSPMPRFSSSMLVYLTEVDHHDHEALLALEPGTGDALGVARYVRLAEDHEAAEAAVTVVDDWQGRGLGRALLEQLAGRAREEGVRRFTAFVLASNPGAIRVLEGLGEAKISHEGQNVEIRIDLPEQPGIGPQLARLLRETAAGTLRATGLALRPAARWSPPPPGEAFAVIVAGTDGSPGAGAAVGAAVDLAACLRSELHLVSAYGLPGGLALPEATPAVPAPLRRLLSSREEAQGALAQAERAARDRGLEPLLHACRDDPAQALVEVADKVGARLVVVGSKGMGGPSRFAMGGVPDKVSHHARCSVLVVRSERLG